MCSMLFRRTHHAKSNALREPPGEPNPSGDDRKSLFGINGQVRRIADKGTVRPWFLPSVGKLLFLSTLYISLLTFLFSCRVT